MNWMVVKASPTKDLDCFDGTPRAQLTQVVKGDECLLF